MKLPFVIFGAGGHARVVLDSALKSGMNVFCFVDDRPDKTALSGIPVCTFGDERWFGLKDFNFIVAIGSNNSRSRIFRDQTARGGIPTNVIHPFSCLALDITLGSGNFICAGAVLNSGVVIGDNSIINTSASVDHDCVIGDNCHICPGVRLAGSVQIGPDSMIGTGASVLPGVRIGQAVTVGGGSVVIHDLPPGVTAYGVPARVKPKTESH